jgi:hypothetical protein
MSLHRSITLLLVLGCLLLGTRAAWCQDVPQETTNAVVDSTDSSKVTKPADEEKTRVKAELNAVLQARKFADMWIRRLLFRGWVNTSHIGAYASYQLTGWRQGGGSFGPVEARLTVYYLGTTVWLGKDAEWLQVVFKVMDEVETIIEYDLVVSAADRISEINRILYRVDGGEIQAGNFNLPPGDVDYDRIDRPRAMDEEEIRLYAGTFFTQVYAGSGSEGAVVYAYRSTEIPPLDLVVLGYGDKGLTLTASGSDARPRMNVPPPPQR